MPAHFLARAARTAALPLALFAMAAPAAAQAYPQGPITLVAPFPPGGSNDLFARHMSKDLGDALGQPIVIENRPGAGGTMGAALVSRAQPDGHTLMLVSSTFVTNAVTQASTPFDIFKDFTPVALLAKAPLIVTVNNDFPVRNPSELVALIRKNPGRYNYASAGPGSLNQFSMELLKSQAGGLDITHVPYRGGGPAVNDMIGNRTQVYITSAPAALPTVRTGKIKAIGVTSLAPSPIAPDLPTVASAVPGYEYQSWWAILGPAGTPAPVVEKLNAAINAVMTTPQIRESFLREGAQATPGTPAELAQLLSSEFARFKKLAQDQHIVAQ